MRVRFWGVRGSVPWATSGSMRYGCNTPCVELRDEQSGALLVLDAGSGIVGLGAEPDESPRPVPILLSHYHWDHLQGLPFFSRFYKPGRPSALWVPALPHVSRAWVATIFESPFYPVPFEQLPSRPSVELVHAPPGGVDEAVLDLEGFAVRAQRLHHPGGAFAYRVRGASGDLVYATDHEFGNREIDEAFAAFARGARAIIMDAHFSPAELPAHRGWGHASWRECAEFAAANEIGSLWLFHHKPGRPDTEMDAMADQARRHFAATSAAREGESFAV